MLHPATRGAWPETDPAEILAAFVLDPCICSHCNRTEFPDTARKEGHRVRSGTLSERSHGHGDSPLKKLGLGRTGRVFNAERAVDGVAGSTVTQVCAVAGFGNEGGGDQPKPVLGRLRADNHGHGRELAGVAGAVRPGAGLFCRTSVRSRLICGLAAGLFLGGRCCEVLGEQVMPAVQHGIIATARLDRGRQQDEPGCHK
jgi:hypothetical protein